MGVSVQPILKEHNSKGLLKSRCVGKPLCLVKSTGKALNADLNGVVGILRKVIGESQFTEITSRGFVTNPFRG